MVGFFGHCSDFSYLNCNPPNSDDWGTIWATVQSYVNTQQYNMKFIFEYGYFGYPVGGSSGEYAWPQPYTTALCKSGLDCFSSNPASQFWWCDGTGLACDGNYQTGAYLDRFYHDASQNLSQVAVGLLYSGFDDTHASWGYDRVIAQQCGQVLLNTANEVSAGGYWGGGGHQMPYMQVATWNDYEEGTQEESGISNCYNNITASFIAAPGASGYGPTLQWTLGTTSAANVNGVDYATANTINNFTIWVAPHNHPGNITLLQTVPGTQTVIDPFSPTLAAGTYDVYVEMVGQPMIQNAMSGPVLYNAQ